ncbi:MAG: ABC transporter permease [Acidimicrobiia bacterium]|jgi:general nucleoside transport system permease protein
MTAVAERPTEQEPRRLTRWQRALIYFLVGFAIVSLVEQITGITELSSSGTFGATLRLAMPILMAALGGLYSERSGIVNIGLEGMMIAGTWFSAWGAWQFGPWRGVLIGIAGGAIFGLLHAVATVTFNVDHIVSGVAINILAAGVMRFLSVVTYEAGSGGGATQSPTVPGIPTVDIPFLAGGTLFGWETPDLFGWLERTGWFLLSDIAALGKGLTGRISWLTLIGLALVPLTWFLLWRTAWGLRLRSCGENPWAAESLGVPVYRMKYYAVVISGGLAGLGGVFLVLVQANIYREGQTGGRGFIGLATMLFGNYNPFGALGGATLFGFADALRLRDPEAVLSLFLVVSIGMVLLAGRSAIAGKVRPAAWQGAVAIAALAVFMFVGRIPNEFIFITPYVVTLVVLSAASQRLRMPAADGVRYRKGEAT